MTLMTGDEKHDSSSTSTLDTLWVLYDRVLRVNPQWPDDPARDRFLLSKGHGPVAYYAVLAAKGFLTRDQLRSFGDLHSVLGYHPIGCWCREWRSAPAHWATAWASRSAPPWACGSPGTPKAGWS